MNNWLKNMINFIKKDWWAFIRYPQYYRGSIHSFKLFNIILDPDNPIDKKLINNNKENK